VPHRFRQIAATVCFCLGAVATVSPAIASVPQANAAGLDLQPATKQGSPGLIARWSPFIKEASRRFGIGEDWIQAVIRMESGGRTKAADGSRITSSKGAMGLMQLMPETWSDMQRQYGLGTDPYDPHDNVLAGTAYLRWLYEKFGFPNMFAAYNAGPASVDAKSSGSRDLPRETRAYVQGITRILGTKAATPEPAVAISSRQPHDKFQAREVVAVAVDPMATLTRPDGTKVEIDASAVTSIRASLPEEFTPGVQTVVSMGPRLQGVLESPQKVAALLRSHGANV
jgi:hypothetical protein